MERIHFFDLRRNAPRLIRWALRSALGVAAASAIALLGLLVWSTGNASRYAQQYDVLLVLNGILAIALMSWVAMLSIRLLRQIRRRQFGARLTARFTLYFTLIGILPGVLIYVLSVQFMSRSIESWFNVRVDTALEAGLNLGRAALDAQLTELNGRARNMALRLNSASDAETSLLITSLRAANEIDEAMVFTGNGRLVAFSSSAFSQLLPDLPPSSVMNQLRVAQGYGRGRSRCGPRRRTDQRRSASARRHPAGAGRRGPAGQPHEPGRRFALAAGDPGRAGTHRPQRQSGPAGLPRLPGTGPVTPGPAQALRHHPDAGPDPGRLRRRRRGAGRLAPPGSASAVPGFGHTGRRGRRLPPPARAACARRGRPADPLVQRHDAPAGRGPPDRSTVIAASWNRATCTWNRCSATCPPGCWCSTTPSG